MTPQQMEKILDASGIYRIEAAALFRVTRQTLANWLSGRPRKNEFIYEVACGVTRMIFEATKRKLLPLPPDTPYKDRAHMIKNRLDFVRKELQNEAGKAGSVPRR